MSISNYHSDGNKVGIMLNGSRQVQVMNSWFTQNTAGAIVMKDAIQNIATANIIVLKGDTSASDGINIDGKSLHNIVTGSFISGYKGYGINLADATVEGTMLIGNILSNNAAGGLNDKGTATSKLNNSNR